MDSLLRAYNKKKDQFMKAKLKLIAISMLFMIVPFLGKTQLDSISVSLQLENYGYLNEENDSVVGQCIKVDTWISDFDFFGEILITAYDVETDFPVEMIKFTKSQVISLELIADSVITTRIYNSIEPGRTYRVDVQVRDYQGMNLAIVNDIIAANE